jgi:peptide/nickel transport system permease protein
MTARIFGRVAGSIGALFGASVLAFVFLRLAPSDPARLIVGEFAPEEAVEAQRRALGLHENIVVQYYRYMRDFLTGDWGFSYSTGTPVSSAIEARLPATIELSLYAFVLAFAAALILALLATYRRRPVVDGALRTVSFIGLGTPPFWLGLLLLVTLSGTGLFPGPEGRLQPDVAAPPNVTSLYTVDAVLAGQWHTLGDALWHMTLPAITLGLVPFAFLVRLLRANLLEVAREPFITFARSKGLSRWTAFRRHALPNAILPTVTAGGLVFAHLLAGSVLVERVFAWPGVGSLVVGGILQQDFAVVQAFILLGAASYVAMNAVVDVLYSAIDPRTRGGQGLQG